MPWYPRAVRKQLTVPNRAKYKVSMTPVRINLHTAVSNSTSIFGYFNSTGAGGVFSHFYVREDGTVEQYQDTSYRASCDLDGNNDTISVESWDGYPGGWPGYWDHNSDVPPWNQAQLEAIRDLVAWISATHPTIPRRLARDNRRGSSSHGLSWHRLGVVGAPGYVPVSSGGLRYSTSVGKICPGPRRIAQIPGILSAALSGGSTAPTPGLPTTGVNNTEPEDIMNAQQEAMLKAVYDAVADRDGIERAGESAARQTVHYPVYRGGGKVPLIQEVADAKTGIIAVQGQMAGLLAALRSLSAGQPVDLAGVEEAAQRGAEKALANARVEVVFEGGAA